MDRIFLENIRVLNTTVTAIGNAVIKQDRMISCLTISMGVLTYLGVRHINRLENRIDELEKIVEETNMTEDR